MIAVCLLTCDRADYTARTLTSFTAQHPQARETFLLLHGDDGSVDRANHTLATAHGFTTVVSHPRRRGARALRIAMVHAAAAQQAEWVLILENDWEFVRAVPLTLHAYLVEHRPDIYTLRLYGAYKERGRRRPCLNVHLGRHRRTVLWEPIVNAPEWAEAGRIHWGAPPAITRIAELLELHKLGTEGKPGSSDLLEMELSGAIRGLVARVVENVVYHIGDDKTDKVRPTPRAASRPVRPVRSSRTVTRGRHRTRLHGDQLYTPEWQKGRRWTHPGSVACFDAALALCGRPASLLDVGCGEGHLVTRAASLGIKAVGVDLSVTTTGTYQSGLLFRYDLTQPLALRKQADDEGATNLDGPEPATFDFVLCWEVAEHLPKDAADTLCASLAGSLSPTGTLLFTAATPGQGGHGHLNEAKPEVWRAKLEALGLHFDAGLTKKLSRIWRAVAPQTPWYGANVQVFHGAAWTPAAGIVDTFMPRIAITMRTANRRPKGPNYVGATVRRLLAQAVDPELIHLCATDPDVGWLAKELNGAKVTLHVPTRHLTPNENGLAQIENLDPTQFDWVLLLEDDLEFCADFVGSLHRWLAAHGRVDRHLFRFFAFAVGSPNRAVASIDDHSLPRYRGSQAVALRMADAQDFVAWSHANLETWGGFRGNAKIAFDKLLASWHQARWPKVPAVLSVPFLVRHVGDVSSIHPKAQRNDRLFAGATWRYPSDARLAQ